jgi:DNA-binding LacI/PurR family transcriptional regulator
MPRKIMESFVRELTRDIASRTAGDSYLSLNQICEKFSVSYKVAQKGLSELARLKMVHTLRKRGTIILSKTPQPELKQKKIVLLCRGDWGNFNQSFLKGAQSASSSNGIKVELVVNQLAELSTIAFGEYLLKLDTDGVIGIGFPMGALGFCHAISRGLDIVVDIPLQELPYLPSAFTNNFEHARRAGARMKELGIREVLVVTYHDIAGDFCRGFVQERYKGLLAGLDKSAKISIAPIYQPDSPIILDNFLARFNKQCALFSINMDSNHAMASKCYQHAIKINKDNFYIYDDLSDTFTFYGLPPIPVFGPSLESLGAALAKKLIRKWETGRFDEPLWEPV